MSCFSNLSRSVDVRRTKKKKKKEETIKQIKRPKYVHLLRCKVIAL